MAMWILNMRGQPRMAFDGLDGWKRNKAHSVQWGENRERQLVLVLFVCICLPHLHGPQSHCPLAPCTWSQTLCHHHCLRSEVEPSDAWDARQQVGHQAWPAWWWDRYAPSCLGSWMVEGVNWGQCMRYSCYYLLFVPWCKRMRFSKWAYMDGTMWHFFTFIWSHCHALNAWLENSCCRSSAASMIKKKSDNSQQSWTQHSRS